MSTHSVPRHGACQNITFSCYRRTFVGHALSNGRVCRLLATVPQDIMQKSQQIIENIDGPIPDSESEAGMVSGKRREEQIEQFLLK